MKNYTKKPFDLEYMKAHPETQLITRDGREVQEWCYLKSIIGDYPIIAVIGGCAIGYSNDGFYEVRKNQNPLDILMLVPVEENVFYANVYKKRFGNGWDSIEDAKYHVSDSATHIVKVTTTEGNQPTFEIVHRY